jgi:hypothetical protein
MLALLLCLAAEPPSVDFLNSLLEKRDVASIKSLVLPTKADPLRVIKTNGAYDTGRYGWKALESADYPTAKFVVFTTPLTSEDIGEFVFQRVGDKLQLMPEEDDQGVRIVRHSLKVGFDLPAKIAKIEDEVNFVETDPARGIFLLRLSPCYRVKSISDSENRSVRFTQLGGVVMMDKPAKKSFSLKLNYEGVVKLPLYAGSISEKEATLTNDYWYPMIARQPAPYDLRVEAPEVWTVAGQGDLVSQVGNVWQFKMNLPVSYYSLSAGPYKRSETSVTGRMLGMMSPRVPADRMALQAQLYGPIIDSYVRWFGKWPFNRYTALDSPAYGGGALESYSGATYGGGLPQEDPHEPSHTFWGGVIVNTYLRSFWNESFAVFSQGLYARNVPIGNRAERTLAFVSDASASPEHNDVSCAEGGAYAGSVASALGYGKGAKVLQMLEQLIGTDGIISCMREWVATQPVGKPGEWEDFEAICLKRFPAENLARFFRDWLHRPGYPDVQISKVRASDREIEFHVGFTGLPYNMPLEVAAFDAQGRMATKVLRVSGPGDYSFPTPFRATLLSVDPWRKLLREQRRNEEPLSVGDFVARAKRYIDPAHPDYLSQVRGGQKLTTLSGPLDDLFIVGHPQSLPVLDALCKKAGFKVVGDKLTYDGTTIDLRHGSAMALVDLGEGKKCAIGLGTTQIRPNLGYAQVGLTDELGRFLRGRTEPKKSGFWTFPL